MTREDVMKLFPEATDEQVTKLLNQSHSEINEAKKKSKDADEAVKKAEELQKKLDEIEASNLSEVEKANKALDEANAKLAQLERTNAIRDQRESIMDKMKINAEQAKSIIKDDGSFDFEILGQITSEKEKSAVAEAEKKALGSTPNPNNNGNGTGADTEPQDVKNAKSISFGVANADTQKAAREYYS